MGFGFSNPSHQPCPHLLTNSPSATASSMSSRAAASSRSTAQSTPGSLSTASTRPTCQEEGGTEEGVSRGGQKEGATEEEVRESMQRGFSC